MPWEPARMVHFLKKNAFIEVPKQGGHRRFYNPDNGRLTKVPMYALSRNGKSNS